MVKHWQTGDRFATILYGLMLIIFLTRFSAAHADSESGLRIHVEVRGSEVTTDVEFFVGATLQETWAVLVDYDNAKSFISGLERSAVLARSADMLMVSQKGVVEYGPFSTTFETVAELRLVPHETISSRLVAGNMKKNQSITRLSAEAGGTRVVHHLESIPEIWIPPIIGRILIEHEVRSRFRQLIAEIRRRAAASVRPSSVHQN